MDKERIETTARALHEAMRHSPFFGQWVRVPWSMLHPLAQSEYRAIAHSALVAANGQRVWVVTAESYAPPEEQENSSVMVVAGSREAALAHLADQYQGAEDCVWKEEAPYWTTRYGDQPWVMAHLNIEEEG